MTDPDMSLTLSIITPSYLQGHFIERTIQSVLSQEIPKLEYVVRDGGSTDETVPILRRYENRLRWVSEKDGGQADAVNKGILSSSGEIIGWLNSDDIYYPHALETVLSFFGRHPEVEVIYGEANHIDPEDRVLERYYTEDWNYERLKDICFLCQPAVFFRRQVVKKHGVLDAGLRYCMDYEYWLRVGKHTPFFRLPEILAGSRMYKDNKTMRYRARVHAEINDMFKRRLGQIPTRWIYNYAFAVIDSLGFDRATPYKYAGVLILSLFYAYLHWCHAIPRSAFRAAFLWVRSTLRRPSGAGLEIPFQ